MNNINNNISQLEEIKVNTRIQLVRMWTTIVFCYLYDDYFELNVPEKAHLTFSASRIQAWICKKKKLLDFHLPVSILYKYNIHLNFYKINN